MNDRCQRRGDIIVSDTKIKWAAEAQIWEKNREIFETEKTGEALLIFVVFLCIATIVKSCSRNHLRL